MDQIPPAHILACPPELTAAARRLNKASVLVIGDITLDRYVYGQVLRGNPDGLLPVLSEERELAMPGGAGNVVRNLTALGAAVAFIAVVGDDQAGSDLTGLIGGQPGVEPWLMVESGRTTTVRTQYIAAGKPLFRADREQADPIDERLAERIMRIARDAMAATSITVLSDRRKGLLSGDVPERLIAAARQAGRMVIVDPKGSDWGRYAGADVAATNRTVLAGTMGMPSATAAEIVAAATALRERHRFGAVVVIGTEDGLTLVGERGAEHFPAEAAEGHHDPSGAGDAVVATLASGLAAKLTLPVAARLANLAAGLVLDKEATAVVREADLLSAISAEPDTLGEIAPHARD